MQTIKEKISDMSAMRKAKAEARCEEKEEKELAQARVEIAKETRKAKEAGAAMELHANKATQVAQKKIAEHSAHHTENKPADS
ncbi:hypothetical protein Dimus_024532 [Dionaea muscipula]